jgi:hypothetical protein
VNADAINKPWTMRSMANVLRSGATANRAVGMASSVRLAAMPARRGIRSLRNEMITPAIAMPSVQALTAVPIAAGFT